MEENAAKLEAEAEADELSEEGEIDLWITQSLSDMTNHALLSATEAQLWPTSFKEIWKPRSLL